MTGFGRAELERDGRVLVAEARSVNHRYLEMAIRLPRGLHALENKLRVYLQTRMTRGKLNLSLSWKGMGEEDSNLSLDMVLARRYYDILQDVRNAFDFREPVTMGQLLAHPDILKFTDPDLDLDAAWDHVQAVVGKAVGDLLTMRRSEGEALARDLRGRMETLRELVTLVETRAPERVAAIKVRLHSRVQELLKGEAGVDPERLVLEAAFQAERMDCTEECVRQRSHIDQMEELLTGEEAAGRKLNFLTQEMNREANTIGSKANDTVVARHVIRLKEEIEIIREQIQNIE
jgi:uncharacterized protein (TIGR00255 family)